MIEYLIGFIIGVVVTVAVVVIFELRDWNENE